MSSCAIRIENKHKRATRTELWQIFIFYIFICFSFHFIYICFFQDRMHVGTVDLDIPMYNISNRPWLDERVCNYLWVVHD